ncbi:MAG TPA: hypothetical protein VFK05_38670 [Polyangiaceae bacterium]|nr:hypothetical protein [Polyangiaceae bacterium]
MSFHARHSGRAGCWRAALPREHGFWVMLAAALLSALLRAGAQRASVFAATATVVVVVAAAGALHRRVRRNSLAQLTATLLLSLSAVPVELAGGVPHSSIASAALARAVVFLASALVVRAAFARSMRGGRVRTFFFHLLSIAIAGVAALVFHATGRGTEASACAMAAIVCGAFAYQRPTTKELKFLGLSLSGLVLASTLALAL